ncbi:MAG: DUF1289 domain-containing protein [Alphaproteobacteria bacterium]|nr:DUF1289 domain-containing protein [Alphaproteobacteria bacterium]MDE2012749.1 DUF1289 domain-containing protein [Alphaproteobacteria bacterium]MDE2072582.1 DUF1289 domain-containing protein [Alphaproteobacteria bacterium]MDE2351334.1 DUF1289 domain-containing protein [Alphaproteobacteria bacterium]
MRPAIASPCIGVCKMDPAAGLCIGCGRTLDEIARWSTMGEEERLRLMQSLKARSRRTSPASPAA